MNILVANDDGINAKGLLTLVKVLSQFANVYVVAPHTQCSGYSHHFTLKGKLQIEERKVPFAKKAYALWGSPVDCVHIGLKYLFRDQIDFVISGINQGANISSDMVYSGTIGAAREGFIQEVPSLAVSLDSFTYDDFTFAAEVAAAYALDFVNDENNKKYFLNINVPACAKEEVKGVRICDKVGRVDYEEHYFPESENGIDYVTVGESESFHLFDPNDMNIDANAVRAGYVTLSPLFNDEIDHRYYEECIRKWTKKEF